MDFSLVLFIALAVTGGIIVVYRLFSRRRLVQRPEPVLVEYARSLFPVILIVFILRSFVVEPFRIPSGSMLPNLHVGDFILVNKYRYGIRLPVINLKVIPMDSPQRGDVMVFRYPVDPELNFIKRVIGLPGDTLSYVDKKLTINGRPAPLEDDGEFSFSREQSNGRSGARFLETIDDSTHKVVLDPVRKSRDLVQVRVPPGHYFVMGDNRDHSNDSRYWRFVPESHIVGRAFFIWFSWKGAGAGGVDWSRIGDSIE